MLRSRCAPVRRESSRLSGNRVCGFSFSLVPLLTGEQFGELPEEKKELTEALAACPGKPANFDLYQFAR